MFRHTLREEECDDMARKAFEKRGTTLDLSSVAKPTATNLRTRICEDWGLLDDGRLHSSSEGQIETFGMILTPERSHNHRGRGQVADHGFRTSHHGLAGNDNTGTPRLVEY